VGLDAVKDDASDGGELVVGLEVGFLEGARG